MQPRRASWQTSCMIGFFAGARRRAACFTCSSIRASSSAHPMEMIFSRGRLHDLRRPHRRHAPRALVYCAQRSARRSRRMLDAVAPALMLAYAIGRIGCQISGDGDWGIAADLAAKPAWLPRPGSGRRPTTAISRGVHIRSPGVYPTPIYETLMSACSRSRFLWAAAQAGARVRLAVRRLSVLRGRRALLLIERIRVNTTYTICRNGRSRRRSCISVVCVIAGLDRHACRRRRARGPWSEVEERDHLPEIDSGDRVRCGRRSCA